MGRAVSVCLSLAFALLVAFAALSFAAAPADAGLWAGKCNHGERYHHKLRKAHKFYKHKRLCHRKTQPEPVDSQKPNVIMVMTNDQDAQSVRSMPYTENTFKSEATTFSNFTYNFSLCCSSRTSILRGQYTHSHGIWDNTGPSGGYAAWKEKGLNDSYLAPWMDEAGYETAMFGNYLNGFHPVLDEKPPGWDRFVHSGFTEEKTRLPAGTYDDEHTKTETLDFLREELGGPEPVFTWLSFDAPHHPYTYDLRYAGRFSEAPLPASFKPSFDEEDVSDKPGYVQNWRRITEEDRAHLTEVHRNRLRSLLTVDDAMRQINALVRESGEAEETYVVFLSDNGYMMGQHRIREMKRVPYLESISFPMLVKGPGVAGGATDERIVMNQDVPAAFVDIANGALPDFVDGRSFVPLLKDPENAAWREVGLLEGPVKDGSPPSFRGLRGEDFTYVRYDTGEKEFYDLAADPHQLENRYPDLTDEAKANLEGRLDRLDGCAGEGCIAPENAPPPEPDP